MKKNNLKRAKRVDCAIMLELPTLGVPESGEVQIQGQNELYNKTLFKTQGYV